jgi:hypothetical protein
MRSTLRIPRGFGLGFIPLTDDVEVFDLDADPAVGARSGWTARWSTFLI